MAPITIMGHKVYGVFIEPGMGLRHDDARGTAVDDQAEGQYWVINGQHFNSGCCFDYGNAEIDSRDDDNGTMETAYFGNAALWYHGTTRPLDHDRSGEQPGGLRQPGWLQILHNLPNITWRFVTAIAKGEPHHWTSMGGDAQQGALSVMFDGKRVNATYDPMRKQGAILLGNGGDNSNGSQGTFYEGAMTAAGTFPTDATDQLVQANVVAAEYDVARLSMAPASARATPPGLQTSAGLLAGNHGYLHQHHGRARDGLQVEPLGAQQAMDRRRCRGQRDSKTFADPVAPGASVSATFKVTSGPAAFNGDLVGSATGPTRPTAQAIRDSCRETSQRQPDQDQRVPHQFRLSRQSDELLHRALQRRHESVDISNWTLTEHPAQQAIFSAVKIPAGTKLAARFLPARPR